MTHPKPNEREIFCEALERPTTRERAEYLDEVCRKDTGLRARVEALLNAHQEAGRFLAGGPGGDVTTFDRPPIVELGELIGPYKLLERIAEGGMGEVWMAEQRAPMRRKVALKIIKEGMDTRQVVARFEAERQALALMDHPNIAKVLDGGATEQGRPYFVMELVRGTPIITYCDQHRLTLRQRLELFVPVCQAIQHAHQKGIIHRDIKPSNVLITPCDGRAVPKIIDFGVAKAIGQRLTEDTLYTGFGAVVGTLEYMSPEQAELNPGAPGDIDTRSDIYSLGALLYELLTGTTPLRHERVTQTAFTEMLRAIREEEPPKPSTRLSEDEGRRMKDEAKHSSRHRFWRYSSFSLHSSSFQELDWIVMKCLDKDRNRRYETANALVADLRRHLNHEPVEAGPPSAWYRLGKYGRRNRVALATGAVVAMALVAGTAVSTWQAIRAMNAEGQSQVRMQAEQKARGEADRLLGEVVQERNRVTEERNRTDRARQEADRRATEAREVVDFLINDLIGAASPSQAQGTMPTVDQVLARADRNIAQRFAERPLIEASIRHALAQAFFELGQYPKAEEHAGRAVELRLAHLGPGHTDTIAAQNALAWAPCWRVVTSGLQGNVEERRILATRAFATARKVLGPEHPETFRSMYFLASTLNGQGKLDEARLFFEECLPIYKRVLGPEHPETLRLTCEFARLCQDLGNLEQARQLEEESTDILLRVQHDHPDTLIAMHNLTDSYLSLGQFDRALEMSRRTLEGCVRVLGPAHHFTQRTSGAYLGSALAGSVHWEQARKDLEQLLDRTRREPAPETKLTFCLTATGLALLLRDHGRFAEARPLLEQTRAESLRLRKQLPNPDPRIEQAHGLAQFLLGRWPGLAPGIRPAKCPPASFTIDAPLRAVSPVADGRIAPGEYGPGVEVTFDDDANPGRLSAGSKSRSKTPDDLSAWVHAAHTDRSLFLAFRVRDQFVDASEQDARVPWWNDSVEAYINGDHRSNDSVPGFLFPCVPLGNREGFQLIADAGGHQSTRATGFTDADWKLGTSRTADGYIIEFEIPLALIDTRDGPESAPATGGSALLVNFGVTDNDASASDQTDYGIFWAEDPELSPQEGGEDFWTVSLRLVPKPAGP
jgi:serine/threonine protein kinase